MGSAAGTVRGWREAANGARSSAGTHAGNRRAATLATSTPSVEHRLRPAKVRSAVRRRWFEFEVPRIDLSGADLSGPPGIVDLGNPYVRLEDPRRADRSILALLPRRCLR